MIPFEIHSLMFIYLAKIIPTHSKSIFGYRICHPRAKPWRESAMSSRDPERQRGLQGNMVYHIIETGLVMSTTQLHLWQHPWVWQAKQVARGLPLNLTHVHQKLRLCTGQYKIGYQALAQWKFSYSGDSFCAGLAAHFKVCFEGLKKRSTSWEQHV